MLVIPAVCECDVDTVDQELLPIWTGESLSIVVPSPSCPNSLLPQANNAPVVEMANVWLLSAATKVQEFVPNCVGVVLPNVSPKPRDEPGLPQEYNLPNVEIATKWESPAATVVKEFDDDNGFGE